MVISSWVWWVLLATVVVGLSVMVGAFLITRKKIKKVQTEHAANEANIKQTINKALERMNHGELLWELKSQSTNPLEDEQLEFLINTSLRNEYKTFRVVNSASNYEATSFTQIGKVREVSSGADLNVIFACDNVNDLFDEIYDQAQEKQMVAIVNAVRREKPVKNLLNYLKLIDAKYEWVNYGKGILLVVK